MSGIGHWYLNDHLGTPQKIIDDAGTVVWAADYKAFGEATVTTSTITNNLRFPGQYYDAETGLHYNWMRYYDPGTGRYTQADPIGFAAGDENLYRYAFNAPNEVIDPTGEIVPLVLAAWGVVELGMSLYDIINTGQTLLDPCVSGREKAVTLAMAGLGFVLPGGGYSTVGKKAIKPFQVGKYGDLQRLSRVGDDLALHHAGQEHAMAQVVRGYNPNTAPAIAVPTFQHRRIPNVKGVYPGSPRELLAQDIRNLRNKTDAPNSALQELIDLNKKMYPGDFAK